MVTIANFNPDQVAIRLMQPADVDDAVRCFDDHFDVFDAPVTVLAFLKSYPESFFVATVTDDAGAEQVIGVCAAPIGPQTTAFIGLYGLRVGYRNFGIGSRLFQRCLDYIGSERSVGLYAVPEMRQKYMERGGFSTREGISMVNFLGVPSERHLHKLKKVVEEGVETPDCVRFLRPDDTLDEGLFQSLVGYDWTIHSENREHLLRNALLSQGYLTCALLSADRPNEAIGYGCIREHSLSGRLLLGPLYAKSPEVALTIVANLMNALAREKVAKGITMNALDSQQGSLNIATEWLGLEETERCERLFRGTPIKANFKLIYSVFSMDFSL